MDSKKANLYVVIWLFVLTALELYVYSHVSWGNWRAWGLLMIMTTKAMMVALIYMNLRREGWGLKFAFFAPIPVGVYFLLFMLYDAMYVWKS